ncbi:hypothetical protein RIF29_28764 [Crotalaria pallida]|uniref:Uncharacterized protein n=1 Tax=Crotalaria pallida TaxID=3830 RepID=A0AAN9HWU2_CROPI
MLGKVHAPFVSGHALSISAASVQRVKRGKVSAAIFAPAPHVLAAYVHADSNTKRVKSFSPAPSVTAPFVPPAFVTTPLVTAASAKVKRGKRGRLSISETATNNHSKQPNFARNVSNSKSSNIVAIGSKLGLQLLK